MHEESPPPFIVIRTPAPISQATPYERALDLVGLVQEILESAGARFYLKDRLDRAATGLVFELGRANEAVSMIRWKNFRAAQAYAADIATSLDILKHQRSARSDLLDPARTLIRELLARLAPLTKG